MTDTTTEVAQARAALSAPIAAPDPEVLGAVHTGLLAVPVEPSAPGAAPSQSTSPQLALRRRTGL
ncbi:hypothetical protein [Actinotalea sp. K2]|uniref:hypothetical protein n=1 Tax=Actinotalea sp. K2 TaxID=2939438 RepID=UPI002017AD9D|nr:hypothetical protein [Actinotalea sp. K2]MCL3860932.1 hypothetical protein [Actinotalea sp. K2]